MKVNMPVSNRALKRKILKKPRKEGSIFRKSFFSVSKCYCDQKNVIFLFPSNFESVAKLEALNILSSRMFISS